MCCHRKYCASCKRWMLKGREVIGPDSDFHHLHVPTGITLGRDPFQLPPPICLFAPSRPSRLPHPPSPPLPPRRARPPPCRAPAMACVKGGGGCTPSPSARPLPPVAWAVVPSPDGGGGGSGRRRQRAAAEAMVRGRAAPWGTPLGGHRRRWCGLQVPLPPPPPLLSPLPLELLPRQRRRCIPTAVARPPTADTAAAAAAQAAAAANAAAGAAAAGPAVGSLPSVLHLGPHAVSPYVLAPMAGITDAPFRTLCRRYGGDSALYVSEMVLASSVPPVVGSPTGGSGATSSSAASPQPPPPPLSRLRFGADEPAHPRAAQLYGVDPYSLATAAEALVTHHGVRVVDLNFGCPLPKVTSKGGGAAIPARPRVLASLLDAVVDAVAGGGVAVTAKFRAGLDGSTLTYRTAGAVAEAAGLAAVTLHARTAADRYAAGAGRGGWGRIATLAADLSIPVVGNGDVFTAADAVAMVASTGAAGVAIGRGALGRPWLFGDLAAAWATAAAAGGGAAGAAAAAAAAAAAGPTVPPWPVVRAAMADHAAAAVAARAALDGLPPPAVASAGGAAAAAAAASEARALRTLRRQFGYYLIGYGVPPSLRSGVMTADSLAGLVAALHRVPAGAVGVDAAAAVAPGGGGGGGGARVILPAGYLDGADSGVLPDAAAEGDASCG
ncbi:hypothetical protein I4F81_004502 [Pyropia yezoensis]|uniref:Uncharacterized protein n=1 Tax=Pyropia yezoensis TaxID=2788 RepID=A0ACC3BW43_PYRYE|nr:hypothetical protein I4F81_004502 [Neopyropia yezoensis]